ncbi:hypothetical protein AGRA3207_007429 [Actinomadura graeca]|uniref:Uncharacterized protein n=1 Tax=Actinomadura graeca TaxID=2750812 RepID=A0ABX8R4A1_9ACTN|nr:hypothetical protein [Actinomadura graeca]QXJ25865.1 hypothetical protein AGRA3207_007429 [Actinomadura graeca]
MLKPRLKVTFGAHVEKRARIMVVGAGTLGTQVLQGLAHSSSPRTLSLVGRSEESVVRAANLACLSAVQRGYAPEVGYAICSLDDIAHMAENISQFEPHIIFSSASLQSWWFINNLPKDKFERIYSANFGPWLPMHLAPVAKLMQAVRMAGSGAFVINAAYPDAVHPALKGAGLSPHLGIGNVANNVPALRVIAAERLGCGVERVQVRFVAHHYVSHRISRMGDANPRTFHLTVQCDGHDVTPGVDVGTIFKPLLVKYRRVGGLAGTFMTTSSALSVLEPLADGTASEVHAPGFDGMHGGYPVRLNAGRAELDLPGGVTPSAAREINIIGQREDGIADIDGNGYITFEEASMQVMQDELGYRCPKMHWSEADGWARELAARYRAYAPQTRTP